VDQNASAGEELVMLTFPGRVVRVFHATLITNPILEVLRPRDWTWLNRFCQRRAHIPSEENVCRGCRVRAFYRILQVEHRPEKFVLVLHAFLQMFQNFNCALRCAI
jgi:hypothetical protein